tara:strand:- start:1698 stop:1856 length:159 start_codon:yes stop_codon:yes gene_type:complete
MFYWNPQKIKELKEKGLKLKFYVYDPKLKDMTFEEQEQMSKEEKEKDQKGGN